MTRGPTDKEIRALPAPAAGARIHYLGDPAGFGVRVTVGGAKSFILNYRIGRRERRMTIGSFPGWTVKLARERAGELRRQVDLGIDPLEERDADRKAPTMAELADRFIEEHLSRRRPGSAAQARSLIDLYVRPELGRLRVAEVRHADVERLHRGIATGKLSPRGRPAPYQANRCVALLSKMCSLAVKWELRADNPARGVEREPEEKRTRYLLPNEIARLGEALAAHPERISANAIRLLLLTGARKGELLGAAWSEFDLMAGTWTKPSAHTKQKKEHRVPLSAPTLALLVEMRRDADVEDERRRYYGQPPLPCVFPSVNGAPLKDIKKLWATVCRTAGIERARIHDLRHTFASVLASSGLSLPVIGALLGHTQPGTTARYAHLLDDPLRAATERAAAIINGAGRPAATVVSLDDRPRTVRPVRDAAG